MKKFAFISDIHLGKGIFELLKESLEKIFLARVIKDPPDVIVFGGDIFDYRLYANSEPLKYGITMVSRAYHQTTAIIIVIMGTIAHDYDQVSIFRDLDPSGERIKVIETASEVYVSGLRLLCIPEEVVDDKDVYYNKFLSDKTGYDMVLGHGNFEHSGYPLKIGVHKCPPMWSYKDFEKITPLVVFGHIHTKSLYKGFIQYNGSFIRNSFGEETPKGFHYIYYDENQKTFELEFIENTFSPKYDTIKLSTIKDVENFKKSTKEINEHDMIRVSIDVEEDDPQRKMLGVIARLPKVRLHEKIKPKSIETEEESESPKKELEILTKKNHREWAVERLKDKGVDVKMSDIERIVTK